mmetsp:Transcript_27100/g.27479  ORF Transcript_27100/g.27479 Transcript_27100/m.27479 type:complete len:104 (+) Transcript_27100:1056-1367(+)
MFSPQVEEQNLRRCGLGSDLIKLSAAFAPPMNARPSIDPVATRGDMVTLPRPEMKLIASSCNYVTNASIVRMCTSPPTVGTFNIIMFCISNAGINAAYDSFNG